MLEIKNLCKTYTTKKGVPTKALDDVSLNFPETGMVFILGKSGSGKSTLLNLCGGLDKADSGEIIVKGRSSKQFSAQDFDSYRNTYVGFIFQEYNVLNEFTVEENVALALELQGKKRDGETIGKILSDVELSEFASRKPNTLSGGQKQRVAIARALVKQPEIIMADEPTGALDSQTGRQVFDVLKKLSREKLVIVISHDRDFAEQYADRIIELKDGKILSDMTRSQTAPLHNVKFFGTDTVCVNNASLLNDADMQSIRTFLQHAGGSAVISTSRERIAALKSDAPELSAGEFEDIRQQPESKPYAEEEMIRSRLPLRHAVRMGAGSLKTKPVRLVFTLLLSIIAFVMFGLSSTLMLYNNKKVMRESFMRSEYDYICLGKEYMEEITYYRNGVPSETFLNRVNTAFTMEEYEKYGQENPGTLAVFNYDLYYDNVKIASTAQDYYGERPDGFVLTDTSLERLAGKYPESDDEVMIPEFFFDALCLQTTAFYGEESEKEPTTVTDYRSVIGKRLALNGGVFTLKIVGVYKSATELSDYNQMKQGAHKGTGSANGSLNDYTWELERKAGLYHLLAVTFGCIEKAVSYRYDYEGNYFEYINSIEMKQGQDSQTNDFYLAWIIPFAGRAEMDVYRTDGSGERVTSLSGDEIAVSYCVIFPILENMRNEYYDLHVEYANAVNAAVADAFTKFEEENPCPEREEGESEEVYWLRYSEWYERSEACRREATEEADAIFGKLPRLQALYRDYTYSDDAAIDAETQTQVKGVFEAMLADISAAGLELPKVELTSSKNNETAEFTLTGIYYKKFDDSGLYFSVERFEAWRAESSFEATTKYKVPKDAIVSAILFEYDRTSSRTQMLLDFNERGFEDDSVLVISNLLLSRVEIINDLVKTLQKVFLIAGIVLACFSFLLMFNFISVSISAKKREIGILRAIGARGTDVFKIFFSESLIIALICLAVSIVLTAVIAYMLNSLVVATVIKTTVFLFGPLSALIILLIALFTAFISTVIPVATYTKKPPVDSIRAL